MAAVCKSAPISNARKPTKKRKHYESDEREKVKNMAYLRRFYGQAGEPLDQVNFVTRSMVKEWIGSAKNLIYHFRAIVRGVSPFKIYAESKIARQDIIDRARLDERAIGYMDRISVVLKEHSGDLREASRVNLDNNEAMPLVWISRLFIDDSLVS
ncbi:hypothetical protein HJFPF1_10670 [Paramyrothecium foliicola]|nr:hypothetical protein HJFPF1_10670 [Paramyrothecium foliicola]